MPVRAQDCLTTRLGHQSEALVNHWAQENDLDTVIGILFRFKTKE